MKRAVGVTALVVLVAVAGATALFVGGNPLGGQASDATDAADANATTTPGGAGEDGADAGGSDSGGSDGSGDRQADATGDADGSGGAKDAGSAFRLRITSVEKCGSTCRDVTATLKNRREADRHDVRVETKVYADDDLLWSGEETVGTLAGKDTHTTTKRVKVGFSGAMKIKSNGGYVTIVTVIRSDVGTTKFSKRRKVA
ncbi:MULTISPECIES: hypothetical protein [Halorussus]|uniref:hypothetical protein n=1 Tax=Halorussus TaxID=1070314 RepID=UPI00209E41BB|nr:hypothetical protein [Halorussus vallis]USZ74684.1 hypothetical protein NGM07_14715 [Halorussus vallis]